MTFHLIQNAHHSKGSSEETENLIKFFLQEILAFCLQKVGESLAWHCVCQACFFESWMIVKRLAIHENLIWSFETNVMIRDFVWNGSCMMAVHCNFKEVRQFLLHGDGKH